MDMDRIMGVITLKAPTYRQIADDPNATTPAAIIVVIATLIQGFFGGLVGLTIDPQTGAQSASVNIGGAVIGAIFAVIFGLIAWFVTAWILAFVAKWFGGKTNTQEMLRVTGYVQIFSVVGVLTILGLITPALLCIVGLIGFVVAILSLIGYVIGVREAAEFSTGNAIITAIIAAVINFIIRVVIGGAILAAILVAVGAAGGLAQ